MSPVNLDWLPSNLLGSWSIWIDRSSGVSCLTCQDVCVKKKKKSNLFFFDGGAGEKGRGTVGVVQWQGEGSGGGRCGFNPLDKWFNSDSVCLSRVKYMWLFLLIFITFSQAIDVVMQAKVSPVHCVGLWKLNQLATVHARVNTLGGFLYIFVILVTLKQVDDDAVGQEPVLATPTLTDLVPHASPSSLFFSSLLFILLSKVTSLFWNHLLSTAGRDNWLKMPHLGELCHLTLERERAQNMTAPRMPLWCQELSAFSLCA